MIGGKGTYIKACGFIIALTLRCDGVHGDENKGMVEFVERAKSKGADTRSPYWQWLPDCTTQSRPAIFKKTSKRGIVCPLVKDEEGFLSEWVGWYEMQGFDKVIFFDNNSTTSFAEIQPWIESGFAEIRRDWWLVHDPHLFQGHASVSKKYERIMRIKMFAEIECKKLAVKEGIDIFVSVDLDEYLVPLSPDNTAIDELAYWFKKTTRGFMLIDKLNFSPTPHFLEPINLLTIEAFQTRYSDAGRMNYYTSVARKVALLLFGGEDYTNYTQEMFIYCCDFHGCGQHAYYKNCSNLLQTEKPKTEGKHRGWLEPLRMHHYARSLEKYLLKQKTWETASKEGRGYDMQHFMSRTFGFMLDSHALSWGCQLRELLRNRTKEPHYVRPGDSWYRNPEFRRLVLDPEKRGRHGGGLGKYLARREMSPYPPGDTYQLAHGSYEKKDNKKVVKVVGRHNIRERDRRAVPE